MDYTGKLLKGLYEVIELLKTIKKQNDVIIKRLKDIDNVVSEANGYIVTEDEEND